MDTSFDLPLRITDISGPQDFLYKKCREEIDELGTKLKNLNRENQDFGLKQRIEILEKENLELKIRNQYLEGCSRPNISQDLFDMQIETQELEERLRITQEECREFKYEIDKIGKSGQKKLKDIRDAIDSYTVLQNELKAQIDELGDYQDIENSDEEKLTLEITTARKKLIEARAYRVQLEISANEKSRHKPLQITKKIDKKLTQITQTDSEIENLKISYEKTAAEISRVYKLLEDAKRIEESTHRGLGVSSLMS